MDNFFWDLISEFSVLIFQSSLPSFKEKHLNVFEKSTIKNLSSYIFISELNGAILFFNQITMVLHVFCGIQNWKLCYDIGEIRLKVKKTCKEWKVFNGIISIF